MSSPTLRLGIVGAGLIGQIHAAAVGTLHGVPLTAVCVCTPHPQHAAVVEACATRGVHSIVVKPFTATLADADRAIAASRQHGTKLSVIFQRRWYPGSVRIREAIDQGRLGRPVLGEAIVEFWRGRDYYALGRWRGRWDTEGGGVIMPWTVKKAVRRSRSSKPCIAPVRLERRCASRCQSRPHWSVAQATW